MWQFLVDRMEDRTFTTPYQTAGCAQHNIMTALNAFELVQSEADRKVLTDAFESWAGSDRQPKQEVLIKKYVDFATHQTSKWLQMLPAGWKFQELGKAKKTLKALMTVEEVIADVGSAAAKQLLTMLDKTCTNNRLREEEQRRAGGQHGVVSVQATASVNERSERERLAVPADAKPDQNAGEHEQTLRLRLRNACIAAARESCPETAAVLQALWSSTEPLPGEDVNVLVDVLLELHPSKALQLLMGKNKVVREVV